MKSLHSSFLALLLSFSTVLVHVNHEDKSAAGDFHFGPVTDGNENSQTNKDEA